MKGNEKNILIGAFVVAILVVVASWKFIYSADMEKMDQVQNEINTLQVRMDELNAKNANRAMYEAGITDSTNIIDTVLSLYGPGNTPEKSIMMIVDLCKKTGISVSDITFQENKLIYASEVKEGSEKPETEIYQGALTMNLSSGYTQLKKLTDYINSYPERMNAENFTAAFNAEDGRLSVMMHVNLYSVSDKNHVYSDPVIEDIELSTTNIFKTAEYVAEEESDEKNALETSENIVPEENTATE